MKTIIVRLDDLTRMLIVVTCIHVLVINNIYACDLMCELDKDRSSYVVVGASISPKPYSFKEGYGRNAYFNNPIMYGVSFGHELDDIHGLEVAYETQNIKKQTTNLDQCPGIFVDLYAPITMSTTTKTEHFSLLYKNNLYRFGEREHINFWSQVGLSYSKLRAKQIDEEDMLPMRSFKKSKLIPVIKLGMDYDVTKNIGIRLSAGWQHLGMFKLKSNENPAGETQIKLTDRYALSFGVIYRF